LGLSSFDGKLIYANQAWREVLGYSEVELSGICFFDLVHWESRPGFLEAFQSVQASDGGHHLELTPQPFPRVPTHVVRRHG